MADEFSSPFGGSAFNIHPDYPAQTDYPAQEPEPAPEPAYDEPAEEPEAEAQAPETDEPAEQAAEADEPAAEAEPENGEGTAEPAEEKKPRARKPRKPRPRAAKTEAVNAKTVEAILEWNDRLSLVDERTKSIVRHVLKLKQDAGDSELIAALTDAAAVAAAREVVKSELDLYNADDLSAGLRLGQAEQKEREAHWELAALADPERAAEVAGNSTGAFPKSKNVLDEVTKLRALQKGADGYVNALTAATDFFEA